MKYLPNLLSFSRLFLAFFIILLSLEEIYWLAFLVSILAALTDLWDGQLARKFGLGSHFGSILDPIMDKCYLLVLTFFLYFHFQQTSYFLQVLLSSWFIIIWLRNISQLLAVPILNFAKRKFQVIPKPFAKWGTVLNMIVLSCIFFCLQVNQLNAYFIDWEFLFSGVNYFLLSLVVIPSLIFECWIFGTFVPRFLQILVGKHDTFT